MKRHACPECYFNDGTHSRYCQSRGYDHMGPHPDAPVPETVRVPGPAELEQCPCGRPRAGCDYHDPALQPAVAAPAPTRVGVSIAEYEVYDLGVSEALSIPLTGECVITGFAASPPDPDARVRAGLRALRNRLRQDLVSGVAPCITPVLCVHLGAMGSTGCGRPGCPA